MDGPDRMGVATMLVACMIASACGDSAEEHSAVTASVQLAPSTHTLTLEAPADIPVVDVALAARHGIELEEHSSVKAPGNQRSITTNMGSGGIKLHPGARAEDLFSKSNVTLFSGARVTGTIHASSVEVRPGARVDGAINAPANLDPPTVTTFAVEFPAAAAPHVQVRHHRTHELEPGRFATVRVDGKLVLRSGSYFFNSLEIGHTGTLELRQLEGPTFVFVKEKTVLRGVTRYVGEQAGLALIQVGSHTVQISHSLAGAVVAPNARLELGSPRPSAHGAHGGSGWWSNAHGHGSHRGHGARHPRHAGARQAVFEGAFYAKSLWLGPNDRVIYRPPNILAPVISPPSKDLQNCAELIRPRNDLHGRARENAYQADINKFCAMLGTPGCTAELTGRANFEYSAIAAALVRESVTPAEFLAVTRDRIRKLRAADGNLLLSRALCRGQDQDGDWIIDRDDKCPNTPELTPTDDEGCTDLTLPPAPSPEDVKTALSRMGFVYNAACDGATVLPKLPAGAFYRPANPDLGTYIFSGRVRNQPPGCPIWYFFDIEERDRSGAVQRQYLVSFMDREEATSLVGLAQPVPDGFIQFNPLPTDAGTRGLLGAAGGNATVRFRVRVMNGGGMHSDWSEWKLTTNDDCLALGFSCGG